MTEAQRKASKKYNEKNTKIYPIKVNLKTEKDIYDKLESVDNVNGYIKQLIRNDIEMGSFFIAKIIKKTLVYM